MDPFGLWCTSPNLFFSNICFFLLLFNIDVGAHASPKGSCGYLDKKNWVPRVLEPNPVSPGSSNPTDMRPLVTLLYLAGLCTTERVAHVVADLSGSAQSDCVDAHMFNKTCSTSPPETPL